MKRMLCLFLALILAVGICFSAPVTITASAAFTLESGTEHTVGAVYIDSATGVKFKITDIETKQVEVCGYDSSPTNLEIPATVTINENEYSVTTIGKSAFRDCTSLTSVTIGKGVTEINDYAFEGCNKLSTVNVPCSWNENPKYTTFENSVTVDIQKHNYELGVCTACKYDCTHGTTDEKGICTVCRIAEGTCGENVTWVYDSETTTLTISGSGAMANFYKDSAPWYKNHRKNIKTIVIEKGVTSIGKYSFYYCSALTSVTIPESVTIICEYAFSNCTSLTTVTIPESVTRIATMPFYNCTKLTTVNVPCNWDGSIYSFAESKLKIADHDTTKTATCISKAECSVCGGYGEFAPHTYENGKCTVEGCGYACAHKTKDKNGICTVCCIAEGTCGASTNDGGESSVEWLYDSVSKTLTITGTGAMADYGLNNIPWGNYKSSITQINIENGVTTIAEFAFANCISLTSVTIPDSVTTIGRSAFTTCTALTSVMIPESVTSIGDYAFECCTSLTSVTIPGSVTTIGDGAFSGCTSLTSVEIPDSVTTIGDWAFSSCTELTEIKVAEGNTNYSSEDGVLFNANKTELICYPAGKKGNYEIPTTVTEIAPGAFSGNTLLESVIIPYSVTSIGTGAFSNCTFLTTVNAPCSWNGNPLYTFEDGVKVVIPKHTIENNACTTCEGSKCGATASDTVAWVYDEGTLYINGKGAMADFTDTTMPWYSYRGKIKTIVINKGVTSIGKYSFYNCTALTSVTIPESVTSIGYGAFGACKALPSVTIPEGVKTIGNNAFSNCMSLVSVTIPDSITTIGDYAFSGCESLTTVTIGDSVTTIGNYAFSGCTNLTSVTIPKNVTTIGRCAFAGCAALTSINVVDAHTKYSSVDGVLFNADKTELICYPAGRFETSYTVPESVTTIGEAAFINCTSLASVTIGDRVTTIGWQTFYDCTALTSVTIGKGVTEIEGFAFDGCSELTSVTIPESVTSIGNYAFHNCQKLILTVEPGSYAHNYAKTNSIPYIFNGCITEEETAQIEKLTFTLNADSESYSVTFCDTQISGVLKIPATYNGKPVTEIGNNAFSNCTSLASVTIPDSITTIGDFAFCGCESLTSVTIPKSVTTIGRHAFANCTALTSVTIPKGVTAIGSNAFNYCTSLTSVTIPGSVTTIGECAFSFCERLTSITIPQSVTSIGYYAFSSCTELIEIKVAEGNINYLSVDGVLFNAEKTELLCYPAGKKGNYEIPTTVTKIAPEAFSGNTLLESVTIPYGVTSIGHNAFYECTSLTSVTIPDSVTTIGQQAFYGCTSLASVTIGDRVTTIGWQTFYDCTSLTSVTIGKGVTEIDDDAFEGCEDVNLIVEPGSYAHNYAKTKNIPYTFNGYNEAETAQIEKLTFTEILNDNEVIAYSVTARDTSISGALKIPATYNGKPVTEIGNYAFANCISLTSVTIPDSVTTIGAGAFKSCFELISITIPESVTAIGSYAFDGCAILASISVDDANTKYSSVDGVLFNKDKTELICYPTGQNAKSYTILDSVITIGEDAFKDCTKLTSVTIPDRVTTIGESAFYGCSGLETITIPKSVTSIGDFAFDGCSELTSVTIPGIETTIGDNAFSDCPKVTLLVEENSNAYDYASENNIEYITYVGGSGELGKLTFTPIYEEANNENSEITGYSVTDCHTSISGALTIPSKYNGKPVTAIGDNAFSNCTSLTSVEILPDSVETIGENAFKDCSENLLLLVKGGSALEIYAEEEKIVYISFKTDKTSYNAEVVDCSRLITGSLTIPSEYSSYSVTAIGENAFSECTELTSVIIPKSVTTIGENAFANCDTLNSVEILGNVTIIGAHTFEYCMSLSSITIPKSVTEIGENAFADCNNLSSITIPEGVTTIGDNAFSNCTKLETVTIGKSVTTIGEGTFAYCNKLSSVIIPNSVTTIGKNAFDSCTNLESVTIGENVGKIDDGTFGNCTSLKTIKIPDSVKTIGAYAFKDCSSLKEIAIPKSVETIGANAFRTCEKLTEIIIPKSVTSIGAEAFYNCGNLKYIFFEGTEVAQKNLGDALVTNAKIHYGSSTHTFNENYTVDTEPTCTEKGSESQHCKYCEETQNSKEIKENGHTSVKGGTPDVHTKCDVCEEVLSATHNPTSKVTTAPTCTKEGVKTFTCECGYTYTKPVATLGHDIVSHSAKSATCEAIGWYAYDTCSRCDYTTYKEIAKLGHNIVIDKAVAPTCTKTGLTEGSHCTRCNGATKAQQTIAKKAHAEVTVTGKAATCTATGLTDGKKCSVCGATTVAQQTIAKKGHTEVIIPKVAPTLTSTGLTEGKKCSVCGTVTVSQQVIAKLVLVAPVITSITSTTGGVKFTWGAVPYAAKYKIYRKTYHPSTGKWDAKWKKINKVEVKGTEYVDSTAKLGTQYMYLVKAVNGKVTKNSAASSIVTFKISPTPTIHLKSNGIKVKWAETVVSAENYRIYRAEYNESTKKYNSYKKVKTVKGTTKSWTDTSVKSGKKYKYCVKAVRGSVVCDKVQTKPIYYLTKPKVTVATATNGIVVNWSAKGASKYRVYRSELQNGVWSGYKEIATPNGKTKTYTDTTAVAGVQYKYKIKAVKSKTGIVSSATKAVTR